MGSWLNVRETAAHLGVSTATVYNWERAGLLPQRPPEGPVRFPAPTVRMLAADLAEGKIGRLRRRANRRSSERRTFPPKYPGGGSISPGRLRNILRLLPETERNPLRPLLAVALRLLVERGETRFAGPDAPLEFRAFSRWRRRAVRTLIRDWFRSAGDSPLPAWCSEIFRTAVPFPAAGDVLGSYLQLLRPEGDKSRAGSYFTPPETARLLIGELPESGTVLDPACGSGQFLLAAAERGRKIDELLGIEIDPAAAFAAALNLLLAFPETDRKPHILLRDALRSKSRFRGDHLAANPPWGRADTDSGDETFASRELAARFLAAAPRLTAPGGAAAMLIPESLLAVHRHRKVREFLARRVTIRKIRQLGRCFPGVFSRAVLLCFDNRPPRPGDRAEWITHDGRVIGFPPVELSAESWLPVGEEPETAAILAKMYAPPHLTLAGRAQWALGIVTGDNHRILRPVGTPGCEPVYRGCEVLPGRLAPPRYALRFRPEEFQQSAPEQFYRAPEKLVYRFIGGKLVFACDRSGALTLNSANLLLIPPEVYPMEVAAALFSSMPYNFLFQKKFHTLKVLRRDLERLPLPLPPADEFRCWKTLAGEIAAGNEKTAAELDRRLCGFFRFTPEERFFMEHAVKLQNRR